VAKRLFISEETVKSHLNNVFQKLGVQDRVELTRYAIREGIVGVHE
jgi:two-component system nitrate/nitrite response regulator NarL